MRLRNRALFLGSQLENAPLGAVGEKVQRAIGSLTHVADALACGLQILEQTLFANHLLTFERETHEVLTAHAANEQAVLPRGEEPSRVEHHAARSDDRVPVIARLL